MLVLNNLSSLKPSRLGKHRDSIAGQFNPRRYQPRPSFLEPLPKLLGAQTRNRMLVLKLKMLRD